MIAKMSQNNIMHLLKLLRVRKFENLSAFMITVKSICMLSVIDFHALWLAPPDTKKHFWDPTKAGIHSTLLPNITWLK